VNAWQHPLEQCGACGQDILLHPEITPDLRMVYVRQCSGCSPAMDGPDASSDEERGRAEAAPAYGVIAYEGIVGGDPWSDDDPDMDARWEAFAARAEGDELDADQLDAADEPSEGSFVFAMEERGRRRIRLRLPQRLRQPA
jgi:hypothetical protein